MVHTKFIIQIRMHEKSILTSHKSSTFYIFIFQKVNLHNNFKQCLFRPFSYSITLSVSCTHFASRMDHHVHKYNFCMHNINIYFMCKYNSSDNVYIIHIQIYPYPHVVAFSICGRCIRIYEEKEVRVIWSRNRKRIL